MCLHVPIQLYFLKNDRIVDSILKLVTAIFFRMSVPYRVVDLPSALSFSAFSALGHDKWSHTRIFQVLNTAAVQPSTVFTSVDFKLLYFA